MDRRPHVAIVGGGWAGFSAAHALARARLPIDVTVVEAAKQPGGLAAGWEGADGRPVEVGIHGFWRNYRNVDRVVADLGLQPFTPFTPSALYTTDGLAVTAPVLGDRPRLPAPLGTAVWPAFGPSLGPLDRLSALRALGAFLDFDGTDAAWRRWDGITAREAFRGLSPALYEQFVEPCLLVLPMAPGDDISAAAALSLFSYFALEHQADFDVRWLRDTATAAIFAPWRRDLARRGVRFAYGRRVSAVDVAEGPAGTPRVRALRCAGGDALRCDAVISAVGIAAAQGIARACPALSRAPGSEFRDLHRLRAVDVVAVRLWLRRRLPLPQASNVCGAGLSPGLERTGFTFYEVDALQPRAARGGRTTLEVDYYYAGALLGMDDARVVATTLRALRRACPGALGSLAAEDVEATAVVRSARAVSHFAPGTYASLPGIASRGAANWWWAGDWVDRAGTGAGPRRRPPSRATRPPAPPPPPSSAPARPRASRGPCPWRRTSPTSPRAARRRGPSGPS